MGSVIRTLGDMNFDFNNNVFNNNQAAIGGEIATNPTHVRFVIYEVSEAFLYLDNVSPDYMKNHHGTVNLFSYEQS